MNGEKVWKRDDSSAWDVGKRARQIESETTVGSTITGIWRCSLALAIETDIEAWREALSLFPTAGILPDFISCTKRHIDLRFSSLPVQSITTLSIRRRIRLDNKGGSSDNREHNRISQRKAAEGPTSMSSEI